MNVLISIFGFYFFELAVGKCPIDFLDWFWDFSLFSGLFVVNEFSSWDASSGANWHRCNLIRIPPLIASITDIFMKPYSRLLLFFSYFFVESVGFNHLLELVFCQVAIRQMMSLTPIPLPFGSCRIFNFLNFLAICRYWFSYLLLNPRCFWYFTIYLFKISRWAYDFLIFFAARVDYWAGYYYISIR